MKHIPINACMDCPYFRDYDNQQSGRKDYYCRLSSVPIVLGTSSIVQVSTEVPEWCQLDDIESVQNLDPTKETWIEVKDGLPEMSCKCYCEAENNGQFMCFVLDFCPIDKVFSFTGDGHFGTPIENVLRYKILPEGKNI